MEHEKFALLVEQYERLVYTICYHLVKDYHIAQDLSQETFLSAYANINTCPKEYMKPWLAKIASNKAKDHLKSAYNRRIYAPGDDSFPETGNVLYMKPEQPEELVIEKAVVEEIKEIICELKEPYNKVSIMFFIEEKSVEEIANKLGRPSKTVHTQLYRAKQMLRKELKGVVVNELF